MSHLPALGLQSIRSLDFSHLQVLNVDVAPLYLPCFDAVYSPTLGIDCSCGGRLASVLQVLRIERGVPAQNKYRSQ